MARTLKFVHVRLHDGQDFYFGSMKAIFTVLSPEQVGCKIHDLYKHGLPYTTEKATIQRGEVVRMPQNKEK